MAKNVDIIGIQMDLGASKRGVNMGPAAIRYADICNEMTAQGISWHDRGDILPMPQGMSRDNMKNYQAIIEANGRLYKEVSRSLLDGAVPVVLGGDHSVAAGSIPAVSKHWGNIGLIWVDAHGDFNNQDSTESGNMHGMPFSAVCGFGPHEMVDYGEKPVFVNPRHGVQVGARDIDPKERERMKQAGITVFSITDIDKLGMHQVMKEAIKIAGGDTAGIHVSFDVDAITPGEAPGVGTPVHSGLTVREAFLAAEMLAESQKVLSLDMVEVNPILDHENKTGKLACELILSILGKTVY